MIFRYSQAMKSVRAAIVQRTPTPLDIDRGAAALPGHVEDALDTGARLIAFGETFLGAYPIWLDEAPGAALWDHPGAKALHGVLMRQAIVADDPRLAPVQKLCDRAEAVVVVGAHERVRRSLYNAQIILRPQKAPLIRRKLVPTHGERLIWGRGDGSTLAVADTPLGRVGGLICWEHWMPLARAAMHHQDEDVHVAQWPTVREPYLLASRHYAFEGRCFVLAAGTVLNKDAALDALDGLGEGPDGDARALLEALPDGQLQFGASAIIGPDAAILASAGKGEEILTAQLELTRRHAELASLDTDGHYARPDVFELRVDARARLGLTFDADPAPDPSTHD